MNTILACSGASALSMSVLPGCLASCYQLLRNDGVSKFPAWLSAVMSWRKYVGLWVSRPSLFHTSDSTLLHCILAWHPICLIRLDFSKLILNPPPLTHTHTISHVHIYSTGIFSVDGPRHHLMPYNFARVHVFDVPAWQQPWPNELDG